MVGLAVAEGEVGKINYKNFLKLQLTPWLFCDSISAITIMSPVVGAARGGKTTLYTEVLRDEDAQNFSRG